MNKVIFIIEGKLVLELTKYIVFYELKIIYYI